MTVGCGDSQKSVGIHRRGWGMTEGRGDDRNDVIYYHYLRRNLAEVAELVDAPVSKTGRRESVPVRLRPSAPSPQFQCMFEFFLI